MNKEELAEKFSRLRNKLRRADLLTAGNAAFVMLLFGAFVVVAGYINQHPEGFSLKAAAADFYANVGAELVSIAVTVLIIDTLHRRRDARSEKRRLIREMGSPDNGIALRAAREITEHNYHWDGSLHHADLMGANLQGARLLSADLRWAIIHYANLVRATLYGANLRRAVLWGAKLMAADLRMADLKDADLIWADLRDAKVTIAQLQKAGMLRGATLPDGQRYDGRFKLRGDINQAKTDGIDTDDLEAVARWYAISYEEFERSLDIRKDRPETTDWGRS